MLRRNDVIDKADEAYQNKRLAVFSGLV